MILDHLDAERFSALGLAPLVVIDLAESDAQNRAARLAATTAMVVGVDRAGTTPPINAWPFDCLVTIADDPPTPWVRTANVSRWLAKVEARVAMAPVAAATCRQVLRMGDHLPVADALAVESLAYSTLLGGEEFRRWRVAATIIASDLRGDGSPVRFDRDGDHVTLTLCRPFGRNAMTAAMRDALWEALAAVLDDPSEPRVTLRGDGRCFSTGGHLPEFGTATDLAEAHAVRTARSCAGLLIELGDRAEVVLHGACIGSGIEIPAAAARRRAVEGAFFQLPELAMGLMPGAGGTVTLARAIGRYRTAAMLLSGCRLPAREALRWGLVHTVEEAR
jgi:enoyl-CoA hydratase/carnithine racemase